MASPLPTYIRLLAEGFEKDRASAIQRTNMDDGFTKQTQTKSRVFVTRKFTLEFTSLSDYQSFIVFFQTTLGYGAAFFTFNDPEDGVNKLGRFVNKVDRERPIFGTSRWRIDSMIETWSG